MLKPFNFNLEIKSFAIIGLKASTSILIFTTLFYRLLNPYLWLDESVQFWVSQGLSPFAEPNSYRNGVGMVLEQNRLNNLDPGGFSVILHYWILLSTDYRWLRFLPTFFFFGGLLTFFKLLKKLKVGDFWIYFTAIIFVFGPSVSLKTSEVRAYSMEFFGIGLTLLAAHSVLRSANGKNILFFLFSGIFVVTSRYDGAIFYMALLPFIIIAILNSRAIFIKKIIYIFLISFISLCVLTIIYFNQAVHQNPSLKSPGYLKTISNHPTLIFEKISLVYILIIIIISITNAKYRNLNTNLAENVILKSLLLCNIVLIVLSTLGKLPWAPLSPQNFSLYIPTVILLIITSSRIFLVQERLKVRVFCIVAAISFFTFTSHHFHTLSISPVSDPYVRYLDGLKSHRGSSFLVDCAEVPSIRYLMEFGNLRESIGAEYPINFKLRDAYNCSNGNFYWENTNFDFIITGDNNFLYDLTNYNPVLENKRIWKLKSN